MTDAELASIRAFGGFSNPPGIEVKYFATTLAGARAYAERAAAAFGEGPFHVVETSILTSDVRNEMVIFVDGGLETVVLPSGQLTKLTAPNILRASGAC